MGADSHPMVGRQLGNYVIRSLLGEGGMGAVFLAEHAFLGDRVAVKVLHGTFAQNASITHRFFQEAKATREISHPSVVKILDFGKSDDGSLYLVMEFLKGQSLSARLEGGRLEESSAVAVACEVADALAAAHASGIIHRDLKPDNVFLLEAGGLKVVDFGIAKVLDSAGNTGTGAVMGTPRYMAPEQAQGAKMVTPASDVYSLGVMLFEMLTGRPPFDGTTLTEVITKVLLEPPPAPSAFAPISPALEELILQCLEKDPTRRPPSMGELRRRLGSPTGGFAVRAAPTDPTLNGEAPPRLPRHVTTLSNSNGELAPRGITTLSSKSQQSRRSTVVIGGAVAAGVIAAIAVGKTAFWHQAESPPTATVAAVSPPLERKVEATKAAPVAPSPPRPEHVSLRIASQPAGAEVYRAADGILLGRTPIEQEVVKTDGNAVFIVKQAGYVDARVELSAGQDGDRLVKLERIPSHSAAKPDRKPSAISPATPPQKKPTKPIHDGVFDPFAQ